MTLIACDMKTLSADSLYSSIDDSTVGFKASKIAVIYQQAVAVTGSEYDVEAFKEWVENGQYEDDYPKFEDGFSAVLMTEEGVFTFVAPTPRPNKQHVRFAIGHDAACHYAIACMDLHLPAPEAVRRACGYSLVCAEPVYSLRQDQLKLFPKDYVGLYAGTIPGYNDPKTLKAKADKTKITKTKKK